MKTNQSSPRIGPSMPSSRFSQSRDYLIAKKVVSPCKLSKHSLITTNKLKIIATFNRFDTLLSINMVEDSKEEVEDNNSIFANFQISVKTHGASMRPLYLSTYHNYLSWSTSPCGLPHTPLRQLGRNLAWYCLLIVSRLCIIVYWMLYELLGPNLSYALYALK